MCVVFKRTEQDTAQWQVKLSLHFIVKKQTWKHHVNGRDQTWPEPRHHFLRFAWTVPTLIGPSGTRIQVTMLRYEIGYTLKFNTWLFFVHLFFAHCLIFEPYIYKLLICCQDNCDAFSSIFLLPINCKEVVAAGAGYTKLRRQGFTITYYGYD